RAVVRRVDARADLARSRPARLAHRRWRLPVRRVAAPLLHRPRGRLSPPPPRAVPRARAPRRTRRRVDRGARRDQRHRVAGVRALEGAARAMRTSMRLRVGPRTSLAMAALLLAGCSFGRVSDPALLVRATPSPTVAPSYTFEPAEASEVAVDPGPGRVEEGTF